MTDKDETIRKLKEQLKLRDRQLDSERENSADLAAKLDACYAKLVEEAGNEQRLQRQRVWDAIHRFQWVDVKWE